MCHLPKIKKELLLVSSMFWLSLMFSSLVGAADQLLLSLNLSGDETQQSDQAISELSETGVEIGALIFLGADFQVFHRPKGSRWMFGVRYLDIEDDFINFDADETDKETLTISGPFVRYLFEPDRRETYYLSGAIYEMTQKIECDLGSDKDSDTSLYLGGGFMGWRDQAISYNIGILMAPWASVETDTGDCSSEIDGGIDVNASIIFTFN